MKFHVNPYIEKTERIFPMQGRDGYHRFDMNENPSGLPREFVDSVLREITPAFLSTYPEPDRFTKKYADFLGVSPDQCLPTNGSDMAIRYIFETFGEVGKDVVTVYPTFEMYAVNSWILGYNHVKVPYEADWTVNVEKLLDAITENTRIVCLVNPNNPLGNVYSEADIRRVLEKAASFGSVVILDEAYHYFYENTFLPLIAEYDNAIILRTFSKLFSLAALRIGVAIASPEIIHYLKNGKLTFDVNSVALLFAERILDHPELLPELKQIAREGKEYLIRELTNDGYTIRPSEGNYLFIKTRKPAKEVAALLEKNEKVLVHAYNHPLLRDSIRVSVGSVEDMKIFLAAFRRVDTEE